MENPIIVIAGPTASGKTVLAVKLAKKYHGEVINADSRSIYVGMDLGTGKPTKKEMAGIPHHLFDLVYPDEEFSLSDFQRLAKEKINEIHEKGKIPFVVGGSGLYIDALVYDYNLTETGKDKATRETIEKLSNEEILEKIKNLDRETFDNIDKNNRRRLVRALEVITLTEKGFYSQQKKKPLPKNVLYLALDLPRQDLYEKINQRVDTWIEQGFEKEVNGLLEKYSLNLPAMTGTGYKQFGLYLTGQIAREEAINKFKQGDRNLAKKQLTWLKKNQDIAWIKSFEEADKAISGFVK